MGNKGYRNTAKSGVKAASARRRQAVEKDRTRGKPRSTSPPRRPRIEAAVDDREAAEPRADQPEETQKAPS